MTDLRIAGNEHDNVLVHVLRHIYPNDMDYWDGNWLVTEVEVMVGGWYGRYPASLRVEEFIDFRKEIEVERLPHARSCHEIPSILTRPVHVQEARAVRVG